MITLSATSCIDAPPQAVWKQLAELEGISHCARSFDEPIATALSRAGSALSGHVSSLAASRSESVGQPGTRAGRSPTKALDCPSSS